MKKREKNRKGERKEGEEWGEEGVVEGGKRPGRRASDRENGSRGYGLAAKLRRFSSYGGLAATAVPRTKPAFQL